MDEDSIHECLAVKVQVIIHNVCGQCHGLSEILLS